MQILLSLTLSGSAMALMLITLRYVFLRRMPISGFSRSLLVVLAHMITSFSIAQS